MRAWPILLSCLLLPTVAAAGPWPREEGRFYALVSHQGGGDGWSGLYLEYGGPRQLTFGLDLGGHVVGLGEPWFGADMDRDTDGRVRAFVRIPVPLPDGPDGAGPLAPWLAAIEFSVGRDFEEDGRRLDRLGIGASVGRGFSTGIGDGWMTFDFGVSAVSGGATRTNSGALIGVKPTPRLAVELGVFAEHDDGELDYQIGPTVQYGFGRLGEGRLGVALKSDEGAAVTVGWSISF